MITSLQRFIIHRYSGRILSKWIVLLHDMVLVAAAFGLAQLLRFNFKMEGSGMITLSHRLSISCLVYLAAFFLFRSFSGIIRHTGLEDVKRILNAGLLSMTTLVGFDHIGQNFQPDQWNDHQPGCDHHTFSADRCLSYRIQISDQVVLSQCGQETFSI